MIRRWKEHSPYGVKYSLSHWKQWIRLDQDGNHISLLLLTFFSVLFPEMLMEGRICRLESPTHLVHSGGKTYCFYSKDEFDKRKVQGETVMVKGLGELTAKQAKMSMFGENQRLTKFNWDEKVDKTLRELMGTDAQPRKDFLFSKVDFSKIVE